MRVGLGYDVHYRNERFLQQVDNINITYVAMTRAALGLHIIAKTPPAKLIAAIDEGCDVQYADFSQLLYHFAVRKGLVCSKEDDCQSFLFGEMVDFASFRKAEVSDVSVFPVTAGGEYPSIPLNPQSGVQEEDVTVSVTGYTKRHGREKVHEALEHEALESLGVANIREQIVNNYHPQPRNEQQGPMRRKECANGYNHRQHPSSRP